MTEDHPFESKREWYLATVDEVHPETWEVTARATHASSALIRRCKVLGVYLPEKHVPGKLDSKVVIGWLDAAAQAPTAIPVHSTMIPDAEKPNFVYWSEHLNFRHTVDRSGNEEFRNLNDGVLIQNRIEENGGVLRSKTPKTEVVQRYSDGSITARADGNIVADSKSDVFVSALGDVDVEAGGDLSASAGGSASVEAAGGIDASTPASISATAGAGITGTAGGAISFTAVGPITLNSSGPTGGVTINGKDRSESW